MVKYFFFYLHQWICFLLFSAADIFNDDQIMWLKHHQLFSDQITCERGCSVRWCCVIEGLSSWCELNLPNWFVENKWDVRTPSSVVHSKLQPVFTWGPALNKELQSDAEADYMKAGEQWNLTGSSSLSDVKFLFVLSFFELILKSATSTWEAFYSSNIVL